MEHASPAQLQFQIVKDADTTNIILMINLKLHMNQLQRPLQLYLIQLSHQHHLQLLT